MTEPVRPNVLIIMTEQQQWQTIAGRSRARMPNVQRLVDEGLLFDRAYTPCALCCPARAMLLSGAYHWHNGVFNQVHSSPSVHRDMYADVADNSVLAVTYDNGTRATFTGCHFTPEYTREFTFVGETGKLYALYNNEGNFLIRVQHRFTDHVDEYRPVYTGGHHGGGDLRIMEEFLDCIEQGRRPRAGARAAYDSTALAICAEESIQTGLPVDIPPMLG